MASILDSVRSVLTPDIVRGASSLIGESPAATQEALRSAVPSVLAGMLGQVSTPTGAEHLRSTIAAGGYGGSLLDSLGSILGGGGSAIDSILSGGNRMMSSLFGDKSSSVVDAIAGAGGVRSTSASKLLSLVTPIIMSVIGKQVVSRGLDATGLGNLLMGDRASILRAAPEGLVNRLGLGSLLGAPTAAAAASERAVELPDPATRGGFRWWPALAAGVVALIVMSLLFRAREPQRTGSDAPSASVRQSMSLTLPGGGQINVDRDGFLYKVGTYLGNPTGGSAPKTFVFEDLNFETGSTQLTPESQRTVTVLATVLKAYPSSKIRLDGHTDATGDAAANKKLSVDRAEAVKQMLAAGGVAAERVSVEGYGSERPVASNDTDAGRAQNRRIELVVLQR